MIIVLATARSMSTKNFIRVGQGKTLSSQQKLRVFQRDSWLARLYGLRYLQNVTYIRIFMLAEAFKVEWLIVYEEFCFLHFN